jgi:hypothetical protein
MSSNNSNKSVIKERHRWTKAERQYIQGIVHNLSMQRLTDQELFSGCMMKRKLMSVEVQSQQSRIRYRSMPKNGIWNLGILVQNTLPSIRKG